MSDPLGIAATLTTVTTTAQCVSLTKLADKTGANVARPPQTVKILLEDIARRAGDRDVAEVLRTLF